MITPRENLFRVFEHKQPEWIPIVGHVDPYNQPGREGMDPSLSMSLGEVKWSDESTIKFSRYLGIDIMDWYGIPVRTRYRNVEIEETQENNRTRNIWHTPRGDLSETIVICRDKTGAVSSNFTEHMVKTPADIEILASIFEDEITEADPEGIERTRARKALIGNDGILLGAMPGTPLGMMYRIYSGVETLSYLWADARESLTDLFAVMEKNYLRQMRLAAGTGIDALAGVDDTSTTAISPAMFEACNMELTDRRVQTAHEFGMLYFHHSCGHIRNLLSLYRRTEMDAVYAFTIPPIGNVTIGEGRRLLGDRITIIAGIVQLAGPMDNPEKVRADIKQMLREAAPGDHFILGVTAYPNRTIEQTRFVIECCRNFR